MSCVCASSMFPNGDGHSNPPPLLTLAAYPPRSGSNRMISSTFTNLSVVGINGFHSVPTRPKMLAGWCSRTHLSQKSSRAFCGTSHVSATSGSKVVTIESPVWSSTLILQRCSVPSFDLRFARMLILFSPFANVISFPTQPTIYHIAG